jgi:hypothetical protein
LIPQPNLKDRYNDPRDWIRISDTSPFRAGRNSTNDKSKYAQSKSGGKSRYSYSFDGGPFYETGEKQFPLSNIRIAAAFRAFLVADAELNLDGYIVRRKLSEGNVKRIRTGPVKFSYRVEGQTAWLSLTGLTDQIIEIAGLDHLAVTFEKIRNQIAPSIKGGYRVKGVRFEVKNMMTEETFWAQKE